MKTQREKSFGINKKKKLAVTFILILVAFAALGTRLMVIAREDGMRYEKQILSQQNYTSFTLPFKRGDIVDANGTVLATSEKVYNVIVDTRVMTASKSDIEPTLNALGSCFPQINMEAVRKLVNDNKDKENEADKSAWYVAAKKVSYEEKEAFEKAAEQREKEVEAAKKLDPKADIGSISGIWFEDEYQRTYPYGSLAADVIGFTKGYGQAEGMYGLEEYYNELLVGADGREYGYLNEDSELERTVKAAVDGYTVHSTIDVNIQSIVEKYIKKFNEEHKNEKREGNGAENIGCIIMEINTGNVLAMASYPDFDLNDARNPEALIGSNLYYQTENADGSMRLEKAPSVINESILESMSDEEIMLNLNNLWKNYCISSTYEPGSVGKPFTVAAALESGAITGNEVYSCNGYLEVSGSKIKCHSYLSGGEGAVTVQDSIAWSCNVALMKIAETLGKDEFCKFQDIFNFGLKTNIDLAGEARTVGLIRNKDNISTVDLACNSFGQNYNVTMIQMISGFCSLINGGYYYEPHVVSKITNTNGATIQNIEPRVLKQTISESTSALIRQYCRATVMEEGGDRRTGKTARPAGYAIGGKTGTGETIPRGNEEYVVSFMGYAPADDPQIAIYTVVDRANTSTQDNARYATYLARDILTEVLPYLNIFMTEPLSDAEKAELEAQKIEIKNMYKTEEETNEPENEPENTPAETQTKPYEPDKEQNNNLDEGIPIPSSIINNQDSSDGHI